MGRPDSIRTIGLKRFLNQTKDKHRNLGYDAFIAMAEGKASVTSMAKSFNVSRGTLNQWLSTYREEELKNGRRYI